MAWLEPEEEPAVVPDQPVGRLHRPRLAEWPPLAYEVIGSRVRAAG